MSYQVIGKSPVRADAWEKVRGRPIYAADFSLPGMLHGRIVRSPYSSARIVRIDVEAAHVLDHTVRAGASVIEQPIFAIALRHGHQRGKAMLGDERVENLAVVHYRRWPPRPGP